MMKKTLLSMLFCITFFVPDLFSQGIVPPEKGKAVIYFTRISSYGSGAVFKLFYNDQFFGYSKGQNYLRYECDPGEQLFWASSENKEFLTTDLAEDGIYIVIIDVVMGFWKGHVGFSPITEKDKDKFDRALKLIDKKPPYVTPVKKIEMENKKLKKFISEEVEHYQKTKDNYNFRHVSPDMAIPLTDLK